MLHIVLFQPQIPQNTGNIGRMCAITGSRLHLVHPLGFEISDKHLRRSGMDYWQHLDVVQHLNWDAFMASSQAPKRLWLLSTHATRIFWDAEFLDEDGLVFGNEGQGAPDWLHQKLKDSRLTIPHKNPKLRSLNLATSAGVVAFEALRQGNIQ